VPTAGKFPSEELTSEYREGLYVGYRYFLTNRIPTAYSFGFGLSYTTFEYSDLAIVNEGVEFTLTNTGKVAGTEISQLYVALPNHKVFRPEQELKGFAKTTLEPGESKRVLIEIDDKAFRYFNVKTNKWEIEGGTYDLRVGAASDDIRLITKIDVEGTGAPNPYEGLDVSCYESGAVKNVPDAQFAALLGRPIPSKETPIDRNICFRDLGKSRSPILMLVSAIVTSLVNSSYKKGAPDLNALFIYNMPLRAIGKMAGGMADMGLVDALVREAKGWGLIGIIPFLLIGIFAHRWGLGILVWILWVLAPILFAFVSNLVKNNQFAAKLSK
jgi:beta-glucosidase